MDGFSVATGALQVADAGFKLYGALSQYLKDYANAERDIKRLADEVRTTSWALKQLGSFIKDDVSRLCKPEAISETEAALKSCQSAFDEAGAILAVFLTSDPHDTSSAVALRKWKWPFKKSKIISLLSRLERSKTTLLLVFKVLSLARKAAMRETDEQMESLDERMQVMYLLKAQSTTNDVRIKPEANNAASQVTLLHVESSREISRTTSVSCEVQRTDCTPNKHTQSAVGSASLKVSRTDVLQSPRNRLLASHTDACTASVKRLEGALKRTRTLIDNNELVELRHVRSTFRTTQRAVEDLLDADLYVDSLESCEEACEPALLEQGADPALVEAAIGGLAANALEKPQRQSIAQQQTQLQQAQIQQQLQQAEMQRQLQQAQMQQRQAQAQMQQAGHQMLWGGRRFLPSRVSYSEGERDSMEDFDIDHHRLQQAQQQQSQQQWLPSASAMDRPLPKEDLTSMPGSLLRRAKSRSRSKSPSGSHEGSLGDSNEDSSDDSLYAAGDELDAVDELLQRWTNAHAWP